MAVRAPEIPTTATWLNVERPLTTADLRGRFVLLHFWTFACINCQHTLPVLAAIERELAGEPFVIVGVHSPKFSAQRETGLVIEAVQRLGVTHPVVLDADTQITRSFAVHGWPTMIVVDPRGYLLGTARGEPEPLALLRAFRQMLDQGRAEGILEATPLPVRPWTPPRHRVSFPNAVAGDPASGDLFITDPGHHQVVICDASGAERSRIGAGVPGLRDGPSGEARLQRPCGLALADTAEGALLYVTDTGNHAVRAVDLSTGSVRTVAGGGVAPAPAGGPTGALTGGLPAPRVPTLRSPWGLAWDAGRLFIAAAGCHQVWVYDPATDRAAPFAGTGVEGCRDGEAAQAWFAQPSGLALWGGVLYVADAESSSIRAISGLGSRPVVRTVCGSGDLFGFGDRDGTGRAAALQHPIGIAAGDGSLFVADTFNHKIRCVDPASGACTTLRDTGPGLPAFTAPEGVAWRDGELLVADTGNHRVLAVSLAGGARRVLFGA